MQITIATLSILLISFIASFAYYSTQYWSLRKQTSSVQLADWQIAYVSEQLLETFNRNVVVADASVCGTIGSSILNNLGGNAMDAAVASLLCTGVCNTHSAGIGGGSFLMYYDSKTKTMSSFDYRETAPAASNTTMFNNLPLNSSVYGGLAVAVPGEVAGLAAAHSRHGRLPWKTVVTPVVELLRSGLRVAKPLADAINSEFPTVPDSPPFDELRRWMTNPDTGVVYKEGELLKDAKLADTMQEIADDPQAFYNGSLAERIVAELAAAGGIVTVEDLQNYRPTEPTVFSVDLAFAGLRLASMPPPAGGPVLAFILQLLDGYAMQPTLKSDLNSYVTFLHRIVESFKFGYAKRSALGDPDFVDVKELVKNLTSTAYADEIRGKITDDRTHDVPYYGPSFDWNPDSGTAHLSLVDSDGNAVSATSTINTYFGSFVRGKDTGILYNNEMDDFSIPNRTNSFDVPPSPANFITPGKRPMSSMVPAMLTDFSDNLQLVTGGAGGTKITTAVAYTLARMLYLNETVKEATDCFRFHHQLVPNAIRYNPVTSHIPQELKQQLELRGHKFDTYTSISVIEAARRLKDDRWQASGDFRKPARLGGN